MIYALIDDWLYMDVDGKQGVYGRQEVKCNLRSKIKDVGVAFLDYETKRVSLLGQQRNSQDVLIESVFGKGSVAVQERMSTDSIQMIGAKEEKIKEIYNYFQGLHVESLVPYGAAIRAFLRSRDILNAHPYIVFLDDLGSQAVMTIFEGMYFSSPRRISMRDVGYMSSEIKRSWQSFISDRQQAVADPFTVVSNNQEWLLTFVEQGLCLKENVAHVDVNFVVLEGLKNAKFAIHFILAEDVLKQKKFKRWQARFKVLALFSLLLLLGVGSYVGARFFQYQKLSQHQVLETQQRDYKQRLMKLNRHKFISLLQMNRTLNYAKIYYDFIRFIPHDHLIDNLQFKKGMNSGLWSIQGVIYPANEYATQVVFNDEPTFADAKFSPIIVNKVLGHKISLLIGADDEDL